MCICMLMLYIGYGQVVSSTLRPFCAGEKKWPIYSHRQVDSHSQYGRGGTPWNQHIVNSVRLVSYRGCFAWVNDVFSYTLLFVSFVFVGTM
jgi:hypothetical protein